jgi:hypothetical protein
MPFPAARPQGIPNIPSLDGGGKLLKTCSKTTGNYQVKRIVTTQVSLFGKEGNKENIPEKLQRI